MVYKKMINMKITPNDVEEKRNLSDDDSGYELDDSGMIPKLEELKAAGKKEVNSDLQENNVLVNDEKTISQDLYEDIVLKEEEVLNDESDEVDFLAKDLHNEDNITGEKIDINPLEEDFARSRIIEKDSLGDTMLFEYNMDDKNDEIDDEDLKDFIEDERDNYINNKDIDYIKDEDLQSFKKDNKDDIYYFDDGEDDEYNSIERQKFFSSEDFVNDVDDLEDDLANVKIKFYDDETASDSTDILSVLDKIADKREILEAIDNAFLDADRLLDTMERIADSLDRIADSLELMEK